MSEPIKTHPNIELLPPEYLYYYIHLSRTYHLPIKYTRPSKKHICTYLCYSTISTYPQVDGERPFPRAIGSQENGVLRNNRSRTSKEY